MVLRTVIEELPSVFKSYFFPLHTSFPRSNADVLNWLQLSPPEHVVLLKKSYFEIPATSTYQHLFALLTQTQVRKLTYHSYLDHS